MGNPMFQFSYLLPKVAFPAKRRPLHSPLMEFLWTLVYSLIWDLWEKAQKWEQGRNGWQFIDYQIWHLNRVRGALRTSRRCVSLPWFFRELVTSHVLCVHSVVWTASPAVCFLLDFTLETCFGRGQSWALKYWILICRGQRERRGEEYCLVETNITDRQLQLFYWDDSYISDRKAEGTASLGSKDQIKPGSCILSDHMIQRVLWE